MKVLPRGKFLAALAIVVLAFVVMARGTSKSSQTRPKRISVPYDWSHRHVVFSKPATPEQAAQLQADPRYWHQFYRRNSFNRISSVPDAAELEARRHRGMKPAPKRDWAEPIGVGASTGTTTFPQFPAKFTFSLDPNDESCTDFVVFPTNLAGVTGTSDAVPGQPSLTAYQNLYSAADGSGACGLAPTIAFAYNTNASGDTTGVVSGSPVISGDGTKIAFVESNSSGSILHLLQYTVGDGTDLITGNLVTAPPTNLLGAGSGWNACPTDGSSCMISLPLSNGTASNSAPFYNFNSDDLYASDDSGVLHKFAGVFNGTPVEVTSGWPVAVHAGVPLTPPVQDSATNTLFVGDKSGVLSFVRDTGSTTGSCLGGGAPPCLGSVTLLATDGGVLTTPMVDPPVLDPVTGKVFVFVGDSGPNSSAVLGVNRHAYVVQANEDMTSPVRMNAGGPSLGAPGAAIHAGAFDNTYLNSSAPNVAGFMYVCGKTGSGNPAIRRVSFDGFGNAKSIALLSLQVGNVSASAGQCSPVTEIFNPNIGVGPDLIFFSIQSGGRAGTPCAGGSGCVMSVDVPTGGTFTFPTAVAAFAPETGGTSGIIIDNIGTFGQDSSIYFTILGQANCGGSGPTGCAVKLTQAGLN